MPAAQKYLLDSDILIQLLRGNAQAAAQISQVEGKYGLSVITYMEVATFELAGKDPRRFRTVQTHLAGQKVYPLTEKAAKQAARVQAQLLSNNQQMGFNDLCIAATAVEQRAVLITRNVSHFQLYPHVKLQRW